MSVRLFDVFHKSRKDRLLILFRQRLRKALVNSATLRRLTVDRIDAVAFVQLFIIVRANAFGERGIFLKIVRFSERFGGLSYDLRVEVIVAGSRNFDGRGRFSENPVA